MPFSQCAGSGISEGSGEGCHSLQQSGKAAGKASAGDPEAEVAGWHSASQSLKTTGWKCGSLRTTRCALARVIYIITKCCSLCDLV